MFFVMVFIADREAMISNKQIDENRREEWIIIKI